MLITCDVLGSNPSEPTTFTQTQREKQNESTKTWIFLDGKNPTNIQVSLNEEYIKDKSLVGKTITAIKRQKIRWFGFSLQ